MTDKLYAVVDHMIKLFEAMHSEDIARKTFENALTRTKEDGKKTHPKIVRYTDPKYTAKLQKRINVLKHQKTKINTSGMEYELQDFILKFIDSNISHQIERCSKESDRKITLIKSPITYYDAWKYILKKIGHYFMNEIDMELDSGMMLQARFWGIYWKLTLFQDILPLESSTAPKGPQQAVGPRTPKGAGGKPPP